MLADADDGFFKEEAPAAAEPGEERPEGGGGSGQGPAADEGPAPSAALGHILAELRGISAAQERMEAALARLQPAPHPEARATRKSTRRGLPDPESERAGDEAWRRNTLSDSPVRTTGGHYLAAKQRRSSVEGVGCRDTLTDSQRGSFVAATLPLSWPKALAPRAKCQQDRQQSATTLLHSSMSPSRIVATAEPHALPDDDGAAPRAGSSFKTRSRWHRCIIAPGSTPHMTISILASLFLLYDVIVIPVALAWEVEMDGVLGVISWVSATFWTAEMCASFMTSFWVNGELVLRPAAIAGRYIRTWFALDLLAIATDWLSIAIRIVAVDDGGNASSLRVIRLLKAARLVRIVTVLRVVHIVRILPDYMQRQSSGFYQVAVTTLSLAVGILFLTHGICCAWFAIGRLGPTDTGLRWTDMFAATGQDTSASASYQYLTSFHWAAAQLTLGATDVVSNNSMERIASIAFLLVGLFVSCSLVSLLSATVVDFAAENKDHSKQMESLKTYLRENGISLTTCLRVREQVTQRLREERLSQDHRMKVEAPVLKLLSSRLYAQLRYEAFLTTINSHPLLRLWDSLHLHSMQKLCTEAVDFHLLQPGDDLFTAGGHADEAFFVLSGELEYAQDPDSSPVDEETVTQVREGAWLCQAALWSEWICVGTAVATRHSKLAALKSEGVFKASHEHVVVRNIVHLYSESFHRRLTRATPPESSWPNDLEVPETSFADIVTSMPPEARRAIGANALRSYHSGAGPRSWAAKALGGGAAAQRLEQEVAMGRCILILDGQELERIVAVACVKIEGADGSVLVQVGKLGPDGAVQAAWQLPGQKLEDDHTPHAKLKMVLEAKLPLLADKVTMVGLARERTQEVSSRFMMKTTYLRSIISVQITESSDWQSQLYDHRWIPAWANERTSRTSNDRVVPSATLLSNAEQQMIEGLSRCVVYALEDASGQSGLFAWIPEGLFDQIRTFSRSLAVVREWLNHRSPGVDAPMPYMILAV